MIIPLVISTLLLLSLLTLASSRVATVLLVALLPTYLIRFSFLGLPTNFLEASIVTTFIFTLIQPDSPQQWLTGWHRLPLSFRLLIGLFILSAIISTVVSPHVFTSLGILKGWIIIPLLLGWLVYSNHFSFPSSPSPFKKAVHQSRPPHNSAPLASLSASIPLLIRSLLLSGNLVALIGLLQINHLPRIQSIYDVPNSLALFITPLFVMSFWLLFGSHSRLFYFSSTIILSAAIIATQSVAALAAALISLSLGLLLFRFPSVAFVTHPPQTFLRWAVVALLLLVSLVYLGSAGRLTYLIGPLMNSDNHNSLSVRWQLWAIGLDLIRERPFLGVGLGTFEPAYQARLHEKFSEYSICRLTAQPCVTPLPEFVFRDPHNWLISFWLNTGVLGLASFILINVFTIVYTYQIIASPAPPKNSNQLNNPTETKRPSSIPIAQALLLTLISILLFGLADTIYWKNDLSNIYWLNISLLLAIAVPKNIATIKPTPSQD